MHPLKTLVAVASLALIAASPVSALSIGTDGEVRANPGDTASSSTGANVSIQVRIGNAKDRAFREIDRRSAALAEINNRVQAMMRLTAEQKASIGASIQSQISSLAALRAKISADTDIETLRSDIKSISSAYRIYLLVIPQAHITIAADKLKWVVESETRIAAKLKSRIDEATAAGMEVAEVTTMYTNMQAKITEASIQADAALAIVANLKPDNGEKAKVAANEAALKDARSKLKAGLESAVNARQIAGDIVRSFGTLRAAVSTEVNLE